MSYRSLQELENISQQKRNNRRDHWERYQAKKRIFLHAV